MNVLLDELPYSITIAGKQIPINVDYRAGISFEQLLNDPTVPDDEKLETILVLYYGDDIFLLLDSMETVREAFDGIMWFYRCGADKRTAEHDVEDSSEDEPPFSYEYDAAYIYAAFIEAYQIDLTKNRLHWWQFRALFLGLPENVQFCKIMGYRTIEIPPSISKERKEFYQKMKRIYKLPEPSEQTGLKKELEAILAEGGDISPFL